MKTTKKKETFSISSKLGKKLKKWYETCIIPKVGQVSEKSTF